MKAREIAYIGINTALMIICSWISVPAAVPFTLQTFAVFLIADLFTLKISMWSMMVYLLLGLMGFPAFSGMKGGISVLMGPTGGYIIGFVFSVLFVEKLKKPDSLMGLFIPDLIGLFICYLFGSLWFFLALNGSDNGVSVVRVLELCILPFIIPDMLKLLLASFCSQKLRRFTDPSFQDSP